MPEYGLHKCYYAPMVKPLFDDIMAPAYLAPRPLPGAVKLNLDPDVKYNAFEDINDKSGVERRYSRKIKGFKGTLQVVQLPKDFLIDVLNWEYIDGMLRRRAEETLITDFALLYETEGDKARHIYYDVQCEPEGVDIETIAEKVVFNPVELPVIAYPRSNDGFIDGFALPGERKYYTFFERVS